MRKTVFTAVAVLLALQLSVMSAFASVYDVSEDTELESLTPIYYTENYVPGMFRDGVSTWSVAAFGSYSAYNWNPMITSTVVDNSIENWFPADVVPSVSVGAGSVSAEYLRQNVTAAQSSKLFLRGLNNTYFDFQSSEFVFSQESAGADTFYLNGTLRFLLSSYWLFVSDSNYQFYAALDPVGVQFLVDGKPYGDIFDITSYSSAFTSAFTGSPSTATVTFDNVKIYGVESAPELIGFRVYVDSNYAGGSKSFGGGSSSMFVSHSNTLNWTLQPEITFVREGTASDLDLSAILEALKTGLFNSNNVPFLDVVVSFLQDGLFSSNGTSYLYSLLSSVNNGFFNSNGLSYLGNIDYTLDRFYKDSDYYLDLLTFLKRGKMLNSDGTIYDLGDTQTYFVSAVRHGFLGLSQNIKDFNSYLEDSIFSWQNYNLETHELDSAQSLTGQNALFGTAFQSIEENLGRLTYVFASDDEIELRDEADPSVNQFRDSFGGGASVSDVAQMKSTFDDVETLLDTGFDIDDLFDSFNDDSSWLSWFTVDTASSLDSTPSVLTVGDDDPYNHYAYQEHLQAVQALRNRGEGE